MNTDQWDRLVAWHNSWLAASPDERRHLRDRLADASPELVAEADAIVAAGTPSQGFLETPAFMLTARRLAADSVDLSEGALVGPYRIVRLLARGGMGVVYQAADTRLGRDVAIKMLGTIGPPDAQRVDRFVLEARVTASLDHPNV